MTIVIRSNEQSVQIPIAMNIQLKQHEHSTSEISNRKFPIMNYVKPIRHMVILSYVLIVRKRME